MIKYHQAYNSINEIVHINDIEKEVNGKKEKYKCISCGNELIPRLGKVNQHHFAHKGQVECSGETYLHKLGKELFFQEYKRCLKEKIPFCIEFYQHQTCTKCEPLLNKSCDLGKRSKWIDLTKYYDDIEKEKRDGEFIPDLKLISKNKKDKIFIEIAVTHFSSKQKINSGHKIIELKFDEEYYSELIKGHLLCEYLDDVVIFHNFNFKPFKGIIYDNYCEKEYNLFVVLNDGRGLLSQKTIPEIKQYLENEKNNILFHSFADSGTDYSTNYRYFVAKAYKEKIKIRNCFICKYRANDWIRDDFRDRNERRPIFCWYLRKKHESNEAAKCHSSQAVNCEVFKVDRTLVDELFKDGYYIKPFSF